MFEMRPPGRISLDSEAAVDKILVVGRVEKPPIRCDNCIVHIIIIMLKWLQYENTRKIKS